MDDYPIYVDHWDNIADDEFNRLPNQTENRERSKDTNLDHPYSRSIESIDLNSLQSKIKETSNRNVDKKPAKNINENYRTEGQSNNNNIKRIKMENRESNSVNNAEMEDWKREKTKHSKYFKAFPEIRQMNLLNTRNSKKPSLLTNGSLCRRPASINGETFFVKYTCGFDSLASIIATAATDDIHYASFLERLENRTLQFVSSLLNKGVTSALLLERTTILKAFSPVIPTNSTENRVVSYTIDRWNSIVNIVNNTLDSEPSVIETRICSHCPRRQLSMPSITVNQDIIAEQGFGQLQKALSFRPCISDVRCFDPCSGYYTSTKNPNTHIIIELDIRSSDPA